jgi:hypothetical protein
MYNIESVVKEWLEASTDRRVLISHGGEGGRFYVLKDDDGNGIGDGAGDTIESALEDAFRGSH